jgi:phage terminase small subunit
MVTKNSLRLVKPTPPDPNAPPRQLGENGLSLWRTVTSEYQIEDAGGIEMLAQACVALDRAEELAEHIRRDGLVIRSKAGLKENPLIKHELAARSFIVRTLARLGLDVEAIKPAGRPPGFRA